MPPGYVNPCPTWITSPLVPWLTAAWGVVYALSAELGIFVLGLLVFRLQRSSPCRVSGSLLLIAGCTAGAISAALWLTNRNATSCANIDTVPAHVTPAIHALLGHERAELLTQAHITLGVLAALFVLATTVSVVILIRGWRGGGRGAIATPDEG